MDNHYIIAIIIGLISGDLINFLSFAICKYYEEEDEEKNSDVITKNTDKKLKISYFFNGYIQFIRDSLLQKRLKNLIAYVLGDILAIAITIQVFHFYGISLKSALSLFFCYSLLLLSLIDAKTQLLPDIITKPLIVIGIIVGYFEIFVDFKTSIYGSIAGYWVFWTINIIFKAIRKKDGMGYGDFKLLSAIGAFIGVYQLPLVIMLSSVLGIIIAILIALIPKNNFFQANPFGPALSFSGIIAMFWGNDIINAYLSLIY